MVPHFSRVHSQRFKNVATVGTCEDTNNISVDAEASTVTRAAIAFAGEAKRHSGRKGHTALWMASIDSKQPYRHQQHAEKYSELKGLIVQLAGLHFRSCRTQAL